MLWEVLGALLREFVDSVGEESEFLRRARGTLDVLREDWDTSVVVPA